MNPFVDIFIESKPGGESLQDRRRSHHTYVD
jgi:hypothetical protein